MESLGPFGLMNTSLDPELFSVDAEATEFTADLSDCRGGNLGAFAQMLEVAGFNPVNGDLSPQADITLPPEVRKAVAIPESARTFAWAYPCVEEINVDEVEGVEEIDENLSFFIFGGYLYFDDSGATVSIKTIVPSVDGGIRFEGPKKFNPEFIGPLRENNRFCPITISSLKHKGAKYFCWIAPKETIINKDTGMIRTFEAHGSFAYLFHELDYWEPEEGEKDIFFSVIGDGDTPPEIDEKEKPTRFFQPQSPNDAPSYWACLCMDKNPSTMFRCVTCLTWKCENCEQVNSDENLHCSECKTLRVGPIEGEITEERWENQRWYPFVGWDKPRLPTDPHIFSNDKGKDRRDSDKILEEAGDGWKWQDDKWHADLSKVDSFTTDENGWMYGRTYLFTSDWSPIDFHGAVFRRRKQKRVRIKLSE